jgi:DNA-binding transcriptional LysR family regulator
VARLEGELKTRLLNRTTRQLSLTDAGAIFYQHCARIVQEAATGFGYTVSLLDSAGGRRFERNMPMGRPERIAAEMGREIRMYRSWGFWRRCWFAVTGK